MVAQKKHPAISLARTEKLVLFTGFSCNSHCHFCIDLNKRDIPDKSTREIVSEMVKARDLGIEYLELIGGETTIRGDFIPLIGAAKKLGFKDIVVVTNGRMLSYLSFAKDTIKGGITDIIFSIHGPDASLHDALTFAPGAFEQLLRAIANVRSLGLKRIFANTTVVKQNMARLPEIGKLFIQLNIPHAEFIFVDPTYGGAYTNFQGLVPRISEAAPYLRKTLDLGRQWGTRDWCVRYVPLCYFEGYLDQVSEIREVQLFHTRHWAPDFKNEDVGPSRRAIGRAKTKRCEGCQLNSDCEGLWTKYLNQYGDAELKPIGTRGPAKNA